MSEKRKPPNPVVGISSANHSRIRALAMNENGPMGESPNDLIDRHDEEQFWRRVRDQLGQLKSNPVAWQDYMQEIAEWDGMASDGLENEEPYDSTENGGAFATAAEPQDR
jgi:hypothetical protein